MIEIVDAIKISTERRQRIVEANGIMCAHMHACSSLLIRGQRPSDKREHKGHIVGRGEVVVEPSDTARLCHRRQHHTGRRLEVQVVLEGVKHLVANLA